MKTIGLIGGMSWESTAIYYNIINKKTAEKLGGFHSAKCILVSVDFAEIEQLQHKNDWESREKVRQIINILASNRAEGVILGCTEIPLLISDSDVEIPVFNTTKIHAEKAVEMAIMDE